MGNKRSNFSHELRDFMKQTSPLLYFVKKSVKDNKRNMRKGEADAMLAALSLVEGHFAARSFDIFDEDRRHRERVEEQLRMKDILYDDYRSKQAIKEGFAFPVENPGPPQTVETNSIMQSQYLTWGKEDFLESLNRDKLNDAFNRDRTFPELSTHGVDLEEMIGIGFDLSGAALIDRKARTAVLTPNLVDYFNIDGVRYFDSGIVPLDSICDRLHVDDRKWVSETLKRSQAEGEMSVIEYRVKNTSTDAYSLLQDTSVVLRCNEQKQAELVISLMLDVTSYRTSGEKRLHNPYLDETALGELRVAAIY